MFKLSGSRTVCKYPVGLLRIARQPEATVGLVIEAPSYPPLSVAISNPSMPLRAKSRRAPRVQTRCQHDIKGAAIVDFSTEPEPVNAGAQVRQEQMSASSGSATRTAAIESVERTT